MKFSTVISIAFVLTAQNYCGINLVLGGDGEAELVAVVNKLFSSLYGVEKSYCERIENYNFKTCLENKLTKFKEEKVDTAKSQKDLDTYRTLINSAKTALQLMLSKHRRIDDYDSIETLLDNFKNKITQKEKSLKKRK